jgi:hypothetical protein
MSAETDKAQGHLGTGGGDLKQVVNSGSQGFDRAEWGRARRVVHCGTALAILLIVKVKPDGIGCPEGRQ